MGLTESSLKILTKPFSFLSHCKVSCDSPCCNHFVVKIIIVIVILILMTIMRVVLMMIM